jgi:hypothetical protein
MHELKDLKIYKLFNAPKDMDKLKQQIGNLFDITFMSVVKKDTKEHFIIPIIGLTVERPGQFVGIQELNDKNIYWDEAMAFFKTEPSDETAEIDLITVNLLG